MRFVYNIEKCSVWNSFGGDKVNCFLFKGLTEQEKEEALKAFSGPVCFKKGEELYKNGALGILDKGSGRVLRFGAMGEKVTMRSLSGGDVFGAASLFGHWEEGMSSIVAGSDSVVYYLTEKALKELIEKMPKIAFNYIEFLAGRIRFLNNKVDTFSAKGAEKKLLEYFVSIADENGEVKLLFSMAELSRRLKIGRTSLYRAFRTLTEQKQIQKDKNIIKIL